MSAISKLINTAKAEIGYLEKNNAKNLDDKVAGAGGGNYTKYWRDVYPQFQGEPWCACFVSWCFMKTFGKKTAEKMLKHWPFVYCPTLASMTTNKTPKKGSVVLFYRNGQYAHTGIVINVEKSTITTIEGNTSGGSSVVPNGGGVFQKTYNLSSLSGMTKYFIPDYSLAKNAEPQKEEPKETAEDRMNTTPLWYGTVTASSLNVRIWAGTEYPKLVSIPSVPRGTVLGVCATISDVNAEPWYYAEIVGKSIYGFVSAKYVQ